MRSNVPLITLHYLGLILCIIFQFVHCILWKTLPQSKWLYHLFMPTFETLKLGGNVYALSARPSCQLLGILQRSVSSTPTGAFPGVSTSSVIRRNYAYTKLTHYRSSMRTCYSTHWEVNSWIKIPQSFVIHKCVGLVPIGRVCKLKFRWTLWGLIYFQSTSG